MITKYGSRPAGTICPADVRLTSKRQPLANNCSATSTAKGAPTAQPTMPAAFSPSTNVSSSV
jgi:hypothetical protein